MPVVYRMVINSSFLTSGRCWLPPSVRQLHPSRRTPEECCVLPTVTMRHLHTNHHGDRSTQVPSQKRAWRASITLVQVPLRSRPSIAPRSSSPVGRLSPMTSCLKVSALTTASKGGIAASSNPLSTASARKSPGRGARPSPLMNLDKHAACSGSEGGDWSARDRRLRITIAAFTDAEPGPKRRPYFAANTNKRLASMAGDSR